MARTNAFHDSSRTCQKRPTRRARPRRVPGHLLAGLMLACTVFPLHAQPADTPLAPEPSPARESAPRDQTPAAPHSATTTPTSAGDNEARYVVQPDDTLSTVAERLLDSPERWRDLQRLNRVPDPRRLQPGSHLRILKAWLKPAAIDATVASTSNAVQIDGKPAADGAPLKEGATLTTGADSAALITLPDGTRLRIPSATEVRLERLRSYFGDKDLDAGFLLRRGTIEPDSPGKRSRPLNIRTPAGNAAVRGTHFRVKAADGDQSTVEVLRGKVVAGNHLGSAEVNAGQGTWFTRSSKPEVVPLLPAPDLADIDGQIIRQPDTRMKLPPLPQDTRAYHVEVATRPTFEKVLLDTQVKLPWFELKSTRDGPHFIRVSRISTQGIEGHDSIARIEVAARPLPPQLHTQPAVVPARQPVLFRWQSPDATAHRTPGRSYRLQIARDAAFDDILHDVTIPLDHARLYLAAHGPVERWWRVAAIDDRRQGPFSPPQHFRLRTRAPIETRASPGTSHDDASNQGENLALGRP